MRIGLAFGFAFAFCGMCLAQEHKHHHPYPTKVVVGRDDVSDVGPPFERYEMTYLNSKGADTEVERIKLTPPSEACHPRVEIESFHLVLHETLSSLLNIPDPCSIPEQVLKSRLNRRKKGFLGNGGMTISIQFQCGNETRAYRPEILDPRLVDGDPYPWGCSVWSNAFFGKLDQAMGGRPWETPVFPVLNSPSHDRAHSQSRFLQNIAAGKYDAIFGKKRDRLSQVFVPDPTLPKWPIVTIESHPVAPYQYGSSIYPPDAVGSHVDGDVYYHLSIGDDGSPRSVVIDSGPKMLWRAATLSIADLKFAPENSGKSVHGALHYYLNCLPGDQ